MGTKFDYHDKVLLYFQISTIAESEDSQESVDSVTDSQKRREILSSGLKMLAKDFKYCMDRDIDIDINT